ncbi:hypothetical protein DdX_11555 [Ditylenchus destructor]|uniref:Uncharacterized protein n=1 Tax=Ditylenchus destructor TaxID=166010 RepID=A0AAD4R183_9BILA|nr:hypothetical protein DdX_11555 [Ditylenchus destructor]
MVKSYGKSPARIGFAVYFHVYIGLLFKLHALSDIRFQDTTLASPRLVFSVTQRPECLDKCGQESWMNRAFQELVGKNICPTAGPNDKIAMRFGLQPTTKHLIDYSIRELSLTCRNELTSESLPHVLHFFKHLRDHYAFIEEVTLCPFNLDLWRMTSTRFCAANDLLRCKFLSLSCHDPNSTVGILTANVKYLFLTPDFPKSFDKSRECMASIINFILSGSRIVAGQLTVHDFFNEEIFDNFIQAFQSISDTDSMIGAVTFGFSFKRVDLSSVLEKYKHSTRSRRERDVHHPAILYTEFCYEFVHHSRKSVIEIHIADLPEINRIEPYELSPAVAVGTVLLSVMFNATVYGLLDERNDCAESYRSITEVPPELKSFVELAPDEITMTLRKDEKMPITLQLALIGNNRFSFQITRDGKKERCKKHEWTFSYLNNSCNAGWRWNSENNEEHFTFLSGQIAVKENKVNVFIDGDVTLVSGKENKTVHNNCAATLPISCEDNRKFYNIYIQNGQSSAECDISLKFNRAGFKLRNYETIPTISTSMEPTERSVLIWPFILGGVLLILLLIAICIIVVCCLRKKKRRRPDEEKAQEKQTPKTEKNTPRDIKKPHIRHVFIQEGREKTEGQKEGTNKQSEIESPVELSAPIPVVELPISDHKDESKNKKRQEKRSVESFPITLEKKENVSDEQKRSSSSISMRGNERKQQSITTKKVHVTKSDQTEYGDDRLQQEQKPWFKSSKSSMMSAILLSKDSSKQNDADDTSSQKAAVPMASGSLSTKTAKRGDNQRE